MKKSLRLLAVVGAVLFWSLATQVCFAAPAAEGSSAASAQTTQEDNQDKNDPLKTETQPGQEESKVSSKPEEEIPAKDGTSSKAVSSAAPPETEQKPVSSAAESKAPVSSASPGASSKAPVAVQKPVLQAPETSEPEAASSGAVSSEEPEPVSSRVLPDVSEDLITSAVPIVGAVKDDGDNTRRLIYGSAAWVCIAVAIALVLIVVLGNRNTKAGTKTSGRAHAKRRSHPGRKRLLDDKYYQNTKRRYRY